MIREKYLNFYDSSETTLAEKGAEVFTVPSLKQFFECILALTKAPLLFYVAYGSQHVLKMDPDFTKK